MFLKVFVSGVGFYNSLICLVNCMRLFDVKLMKSRLVLGCIRKLLRVLKVLLFEKFGMVSMFFLMWMKLGMLLW